MSFGGTLTLNFLYPNGWDDFVNESGIDPNNETYKEIFCNLYAMYGETYTKENTIGFVSRKLRFYIEQGEIKYNTLLSVYNSTKEELFGKTENITQSNYGNYAEGTDDTEFKTAKQSTGAIDNLLDKMEKFAKLPTPMEIVIKDLVNKVFLRI